MLTWLLKSKFNFQFGILSLPIYIPVCAFVHFHLESLNRYAFARNRNQTVQQQQQPSHTKKSMLILYLIKEAHLHIGMCGFCVRRYDSVCETQMVIASHRIDRFHMYLIYVKRWLHRRDVNDVRLSSICSTLFAMLE